MINLRDSLLKAGVVAKKDVHRVQNELRKEAKQSAGNQEPKAIRERREREELEARVKEEEEERRRRRLESIAREQEEIRLISTRQMLRANRKIFRPGPQRFWFRAPLPPQIWRLDLPERLAHDIRAGALAIAWCDDQHPDQRPDQRQEIVVIDRDVAARVLERRPELILFWNRDGADPDPSERLHPAY